MNDNSLTWTTSSPSCKYPPLTARAVKIQTPSAKQWQSNTISETVFCESKSQKDGIFVEPLMPVQMNPSNELLIYEGNPDKRKHLAAVKNNPWSPEHPRSLIADTRSMPGSRNASKLKIYDKLYYNFNARRLKQEDKLALSQQKTWEGPVLGPIISTAKIPATDAHILPGRVMASPNGAM